MHGPTCTFWANLTPSSLLALQVGTGEDFAMIRVPRGAGIAGHVAMEGQLANVPDGAVVGRGHAPLLALRTF
jgi:hypothetical protein